MKVGIVLPWRETPTRIDGFEAVLKRHSNIFPDLPIYKSDSIGKEFNRAEARNRGCLNAIADGCEILLVLDADTLFDSLSLTEAINLAVDSGLVCYPYTYVIDLSEQETSKYLDGDLELFLSRSEGPGVAVARHVGSGWVLTADTFKKINGWDENFKNWGYEDDAFQEAHLKLFGAPMVRAYGICYRLRHEERNVGDITVNRGRFSLYQEATIEEVKELISNNLVHQKEVKIED